MSRDLHLRTAAASLLLKHPRTLSQRLRSLKILQPLRDRLPVRGLWVVSELGKVLSGER